MCDANGYKQVRMGADGCGWVRWGTEGTGSTKTSQAGSIKGHAGQDLGPMAGEISPDMMLWAICQNWQKMSADGWRWMRMGRIGCIIAGGRKNKAKRAPNGREGHVL